MAWARWLPTRLCGSPLPRRPRRPGASRRRPGNPPRLEALESRTLLSYANVLVNNTLADTTSADTQSETSLVLAGSKVVVAYNDSESNVGGTNKFTGWSVSGDGGATFTDQGSLPTNSVGDAGDPSLAYDSLHSKVYFATLGYSNANYVQVFRSIDGGSTFTAPVSVG
jgi:hypothetical protein